MKKSELKIIISISIGMSLLISLIYLVVNGNILDFKNILRAISIGISISTLFWGFYFSSGWKWPILKYIFYRPNLNGTWEGKLVSDWKDEEGKELGPIDFYIIIRQSFLRIHFTTFTSKFVGISYSETLYLNKDRGLKNIAYLYRKDTTQKNDEILQEGATELRLIESTDWVLEGKYWSNIKTNGIIKVTQISKNHVDSFEEAKKLIKV